MLLLPAHSCRTKKLTIQGLYPEQGKQESRVWHIAASLIRAFSQTILKIEIRHPFSFIWRSTDTGRPTAALHDCPCKSFSGSAALKTDCPHHVSDCKLESSKRKQTPRQECKHEMQCYKHWLKCQMRETGPSEEPLHEANPCNDFQP